MTLEELADAIAAEYLLQTKNMNLFGSVKRNLLGSEGSIGEESGVKKDHRWRGLLPIILQVLKKTDYMNGEES